MSSHHVTIERRIPDMPLSYQKAIFYDNHLVFLHCFDRQNLKLKETHFILKKKR